MRVAAIWLPLLLPQQVDGFLPTFHRCPQLLLHWPKPSCTRSRSENGMDSAFLMIIASTTGAGSQVANESKSPVTNSTDSSSAIRQLFRICRQLLLDQINIQRLILIVVTAGCLCLCRFFFCVNGVFVARKVKPGAVGVIVGFASWGLTLSMSERAERWRKEEREEKLEDRKEEREEKLEDRKEERKEKLEDRKEERAWQEKRWLQEEKRGLQAHPWGPWIYKAQITDLQNKLDNLEVAEKKSRK